MTAVTVSGPDLRIRVFRFTYQNCVEFKDGCFLQTALLRR